MDISALRACEVCTQTDGADATGIIPLTQTTGCGDTGNGHWSGSGTFNGGLSLTHESATVAIFFSTTSNCYIMNISCNGHLLWSGCKGGSCPTGTYIFSCGSLTAVACNTGSNPGLSFTVTGSCACNSVSGGSSGGGTPACTCTLSPSADQYYDYAARTTTVTVTCTDNSQSWLLISSNGNLTTSVTGGTGTATVTVSLAAVSSDQSAVLTVECIGGGMTTNLTFHRMGGCPTPASTANVNLNATFTPQAGCGNACDFPMVMNWFGGTDHRWAHGGASGQIFVQCIIDANGKLIWQLVLGGCYNCGLGGIILDGHIEFNPSGPQGTYIMSRSDSSVVVATAVIY